jgi:uncharacterized metal-binding protein
VTKKGDLNRSDVTKNDQVQRIQRYYSDNLQSFRSAVEQRENAAGTFKQEEIKETNLPKPKYNNIQA